MWTRYLVHILRFPACKLIRYTFKCSKKNAEKAGFKHVDPASSLLILVMFLLNLTTILHKIYFEEYRITSSISITDWIIEMCYCKRTLLDRRKVTLILHWFRDSSWPTNKLGPVSKLLRGYRGTATPIFGQFLAQFCQITLTCSNRALECSTCS